MRMTAPAALAAAITLLLPQAPSAFAFEPAARPRLAEPAGDLDAGRVRRIVHRAGFAEIERVRREGDRILVTAVDAHGAAFRLALDADGDIIGRERLGWARVELAPPRALAGR